MTESSAANLRALVVVGTSAAPIFCLYSNLFCSKSGSCRYSSNARTNETEACSNTPHKISFSDDTRRTSSRKPYQVRPETPKADTHVLEVRNRDIQNVLQPPRRIEVIDHLVVLLDKRLVDRQRFLSVRLDHLKVMFYTCPAKMKASMTFTVSFSFSFSSGARDG